ncbi:glutamate synthase, NADH/NADPH, small subunit domain protein, partial [Vibrio parahaemolyticus V-223/04]
GLNTQ